MRFSSVAVVVSSKQVAAQHFLHPSPQVVLLEHFHLLSVDRLRDVHTRSTHAHHCRQQQQQPQSHPAHDVQLMSEDRGRSLPRNSSQETRIKLLSGFQESYLEGRSCSEECPSDPENLQQRFQEDTLAELREQVRQAELLLEYEKSVRDFLLQQFTQTAPPTPPNKQQQILEAASEFLSSAAKYAEDLTRLQEELS